MENRLDKIKHPSRKISYRQLRNGSPKRILLKDICNTYLRFQTTTHYLAKTEKRNFFSLVSSFLYHKYRNLKNGVTTELHVHIIRDVKNNYQNKIKAR